MWIFTCAWHDAQAVVPGDFDGELFDKVYFVTGGHIREARDQYRKKAVSTKKISEGQD